jgi:hypothetical protein
MKNLIVIILVSILLIESNCSKQNEVTEKELYSIINQIISDDSLRFGSLDNKFSDFRFSENCINEIEKKDLGFILKQMKKFKGLQLKNKCLKEYWPIDNKYHFINIDSTSNNNISIPLITKNRNKILICISTNKGLLSGQGAIYIYIKKNGKWIRKKTIDNWIS